MYMTLDCQFNKLLMILRQHVRKIPDIKVATPYFKPTKNKTGRKPDFYLHETDEWLVFPRI